MLSIGVASEPIRTDRINRFLLENNIQIKENPCISPDFCLNWPALCHRLGSSDVSKELSVFEISKFTTASGDWYLAEDDSTGDTVWLLVASKGGKKGAKRQKTVASSLLEGIALTDAKYSNAYPASWANCLKLKNEVQEADPESTIFPSATGTLEYQSLGIGARMTTLHWPAVDWCMKNMNLSVTANQNSIPRELVYDINEMLDDNLDFCLFPFIGTSIPEGHQGQSVEGMSHGCVLTKVKFGFHLNKIPWGFNADHQPIGGKYDSREVSDTRWIHCLSSSLIVCFPDSLLVFFTHCLLSSLTACFPHSLLVLLTNCLPSSLTGLLSYWTGRARTWFPPRHLHHL
jgi:hypothetical protein